MHIKPPSIKAHEDVLRHYNVSSVYLAREVAERMTAKNVGAVVVKDFGRLIGILTERDLLKAKLNAAKQRLDAVLAELPDGGASLTQADDQSNEGDRL